MPFVGRAATATSVSYAEIQREFPFLADLPDRGTRQAGDYRIGTVEWSANAVASQGGIEEDAAEGDPLLEDEGQVARDLAGTETVFLPAATIDREENLGLEGHPRVAFFGSGEAPLGAQGWGPSIRG